MTVSCDFRFFDFPFDIHWCNFDLGDPILEDNWIVFNTVKVFYRNESNIDGNIPMVVDRLRLPFEVTLTPRKSYRKFLSSYQANFSYTGVELFLQRDRLGKLAAGYFLLTGTFAILSILSFFINPDVVSDIRIILKILANSVKPLFSDPWTNGTFGYSVSYNGQHLRICRCTQG